MDPPLRKIFYWSARILGIFLITVAARVHLSGIDLDLPFGQALLELLSRLWLTLGLIVVLLIAWRREKTGAGLYLLLAALAALDMGKTEWIYALLLAAPVAATGILFLISGLMKAPQKGSLD